MGMFDYLQIPAGFLPKDAPEWVKNLDQTKENNAFQTKDLENFLHRYELTKEGKFLVERFSLDGLFLTNEPEKEPGEVNYTGVINAIASRLVNGEWEFYEVTLLLYKGLFVSSLKGSVSSEDIIGRLIDAMLDEWGNLSFIRDFVENPKQGVL